MNDDDFKRIRDLIKEENIASEQRLGVKITQLGTDIGDWISEQVLPQIAEKSDKNIDKDIEQDRRLDRIESVSVVALELKKPSKKH